MQILDLEDLFQQLLRYRDRTSDITSLGPWLQKQIEPCCFPCLNHIPFVADTYTRNWIARESPEQSGFEALIMRWDQQVKTTIHGHPAFSFYHVISGVFEMELFCRNEQEHLQVKETQTLYPSDTTWCWGESDRYDNFIHRVTCLEAGYTFHIYSDDAQKGLCLS
ncbi:MAG: hypothetical protein F6K11_28765 [Leptolyngbya sp. SIO3F4]|nr:hypothetical protein [Leptolyngbya sp. SIO3F4]